MRSRSWWRGRWELGCTTFPRSTFGRSSTSRAVLLPVGAAVVAVAVVVLEVVLLVEQVLLLEEALLVEEALLAEEAVLATVEEEARWRSGLHL